MGEKNSSTEKRFGTQISEKSNYEEEKTKTQPKVNQDYHFGTYSQDEMDSKATFSNILKNVFLLQNIKIWITYYLLSMFFFFMLNNTNPYDLIAIRVLNLIFFPFVASLILDFGARTVKKPRMLTDIVFGVDEWWKIEQTTVVTKIIYLFGRAIILYFEWNLSFFIGLISFIYLCYQVKDISK